jgi:hypothetical protein
MFFRWPGSSSVALANACSGIDYLHAGERERCDDNEDEDRVVLKAVGTNTVACTRTTRSVSSYRWTLYEYLYACV